MSSKLIKASNSSKQLRDQLKSLAVSVNVDNTVPIREYYKHADQLSKTALEEYKVNNNLEHAYVHLWTACTLLLEKIPKHNSYNIKQFEPDKNWGKRQGKEILEQLERISSRLDEIEDENIRRKSDEYLIDQFDTLEGEVDSSDHVIKEDTSIIVDEVPANTFIDVKIEVPYVEPMQQITKTEPNTVEYPPLPFDDDGKLIMPSSEPNLLDNMIKSITTSVLPSSEAATTISSTTATPTTSTQETRNKSLSQAFDILRIKEPISSQVEVPVSVTNPPILPDVSVSAPATKVPSNFSVLTPPKQPILPIIEDVIEPVLSSEVAILKTIGDITRFQTPQPRSALLSIRLNQSTITYVQDDYHVSFQIFLKSVPPQLQMTPSALETNRCFFLHLGAAIRIHPFALQTALRARAKQLINRSSTDELAKILLATITKPADLVDANALVYLWPEEFSNLRIAILSGSQDEPILSVFESNQISKHQVVYDILLRCSGCHFTLLRPYKPSTSESFVTILKRSMKTVGYQVMEYKIDCADRVWSIHRTIQTIVKYQ